MATESESQRHVNFRKNIQSVLEFVILTHADPERNIIVPNFLIRVSRGRAAVGIRVRGRDSFVLG